jgi:soluble lytic murein transglycosylase-like protein
VGALKTFAAGLLALSTAAGAQFGGHVNTGAADRSNASQIDRWTPHIREASARFGIPEEWIRRVIHAESGGRTMLQGRRITSPAGAMGLMQLMPATWAEMRAKHGLGPNPHDPRDNILAGTAYLRAMFDRFGYPGLFAAYNTGPKRYARHVETGEALPSETVAYMSQVAPASGQPPGIGFRSPSRAVSFRSPARSSGLFFAVQRTDAGRAGEGGPSIAASLFAIQRR